MGILGFPRLKPEPSEASGSGAWTRGEPQAGLPRDALLELLRALLVLLRARLLLLKLSRFWERRWLFYTSVTSG